MAYEESDHETLITEKLDDIEDFLESFISNLLEQLEEKGERKFWIIAPVSGKIHYWYRTNGYVTFGELLCKIDSNVEEQDRRPPMLHEVESPAEGTLFIMSQYKEKGDSVYGGSPIAYVVGGSEPF
ncbi:MAG TPA: hypothetical protein ACFYD2_08800 [Candidatus Avalokitesvara rifleensis]|uniref:hypothetical protein n=1 Tax=Candidatus Avalokitesvara rifleensis TaxID=3367620 RepID=UPI004025C692